MKKIIIGILMSLILVLMAEVLYATPVCVFQQTQTVVGTSSTYLKGAAVNLSINLTNSDWNPGQNVTGCVISVSSGTITGSLAFNVTAATNSTYCNTTVDTKELKDDTTYTFTMTMRNESESSIGTCTRTYITDNTIPVLTLSTPTDLSIDTDGVVTFNYACANTSSATLFIENKPHSMTESSDVCTYTNPSMSKLTNGFQSFYIWTTDGLNTTTSATTKVEIRKPGGYIYDEQGEIMQDTAGAMIQTEGGNAVTKFVNSIFNAIFGIFDTIFSAFKRG